MDKYKEIFGDITTVSQTETGRVIIPHVCNNIGGYGAGVAKAIRTKWPSAYYFYTKHMGAYKDTMDGKKKILGTNSYASFEEKDCRITVVSMVAQNNYISYNNPRPLHYPSLVKCMESIREDLLDTEYPVIAGSKICTVKFGSDLAGGNWDFIKCLIKDIWIEDGIDVTVYKLK